MKHHSFCFLLSIVLLSLFSTDVFCQEINWPETIPVSVSPSSEVKTPIHRVFQRDNSGKATIKFMVSAGSAITTMKVRFKQYSITGSDGSSFAIGGSYIDPRPGTASLAGDGTLNFSSSPFQGLGSNKVVHYLLDIKAGMYKMEAIINGVQREVDFGVGEVLVIAGQSNAAGFVKDGFDRSLGFGNLKFVNFNNTKEAFEGNDPQGNDKHFPWFWGRLGTKLAQSLQVPVAFYQTAWSNSSVRHWKRTANGEASGQFTQEGQPYRNFKFVITEIRNKVGLRGVLWQQGERDKGNMTSSNYADTLRNLIAKTRADMGQPDFPWVITQTSYILGSDDNNIREGQRSVVGRINGVLKEFGDGRAATGEVQTQHFLGPNTDDIPASARRSGLDEPTHFATDVTKLSGADCGQCLAADKWFTSLTQAASYNGQNFFGNSVPALNAQLAQGPGGKNVCDCGYTLMSASQISGQAKGQFTFHSCNVYSLTWQMLNGGTVLASNTLAPGSATITFDIPSGVASGSYTLRVTPNNCTGDGSTNYERPFTYNNPNGSIYLGLTPSSQSVPQAGGSYYISVNSNTNWTVGGSLPSWLSVSPTSGSGNGSFTITVAQNTTGSLRSSTLTVSGTGVSSQGFTVTQEASSGTCFRFDLANYYYSTDPTLAKQRLDINSSGYVKVNPASSSTSQIWRVETVGAYKKISRYSNSSIVLGVVGNGSGVGSEIELQTYTGNDAQLWEEEKSASVTTNCAGCAIYKRKNGGGNAFGSPLGSWGSGEDSNSGENSVRDIRLVTQADAYTYGMYKWVLTPATCPGGRVSAEEITQPESRLSVSSNPNAGEFRVRFFLAPGRKGDLGVTDLTGRVVYQRAVTGDGEQTVDVKLAPSVSGTVIVSLKTEKGVLSERVLVTR